MMDKTIMMRLQITVWSWAPQEGWDHGGLTVIFCHLCPWQLSSLSHPSFKCITCT